MASRNASLPRNPADRLAEMLFDPIAVAGLHLKEQVTESAANCQRHSDRPVDGRRQLALPGFTQVRKDDGDEQEGLESLAQNDDERLKHNQVLTAWRIRTPLNGRFAVCLKLKMIVNIG